MYKHEKKRKHLVLIIVFTGRDSGKDTKALTLKAATVTLKMIRYCTLGIRGA